MAGRHVQCHLANDVGARRVHGEDEPRNALSGTCITTESPSQISLPGTITTCGIAHRPRMLIDRYRVTTDETSGLVNDPNDWCKAHNNPRCVVHLTRTSRPSESKRCRATRAGSLERSVSPAAVRNVQVITGCIGEIGMA